MIRNDLRDNFINDVYEVISKDIALTCYMSEDKTRVMKIWNIKHYTSEIRHFIYSKEDISLSNFLFRVEVYIFNEDSEYCSHYIKWMSLIELWNENWVKISQDHFIEFRNKVKEKFDEYSRRID